MAIWRSEVKITKRRGGAGLDWFFRGQNPVNLLLTMFLGYCLFWLNNHFLGGRIMAESQAALYIFWEGCYTVAQLLLPLFFWTRFPGLPKGHSLPLDVAGGDHTMLKAPRVIGPWPHPIRTFRKERNFVEASWTAVL